MKWLVVFLVAALGSASMGASLRQQAKFEARLPVVPNADAIERWGAGLAAPAATAYWLQYLSTVGGWIIEENLRTGAQLRERIFGHEVRGRWAEGFLHSILQLAPHFPEPYLYGGIMFYWYGKDVSIPKNFLEKAYQANIPKWEVPFYLGVYAYRNHDFEEALLWLQRASLYPNAHAIVPLTATLVSAQSGKPEAGLVLLDTLLLQLPPSMEPFREIIERDRDIHRQLFELNVALEDYKSRFGEYPDTLETLVEANLISPAQLDIKAHGTLRYEDGKVLFDATL